MQNRFWNLIPWCLTDRRSLIASANMNVIVRSLTFVELRTECSFHIVQTVFDKNIMSVWSSAEVTGDRIPAGLTFFRGYDRKSIIRFCLWGYQIDRELSLSWISIWCCSLRTWCLIYNNVKCVISSPLVAPNVTWKITFSEGNLINISIQKLLPQC